MLHNEELDPLTQRQLQTVTEEFAFDLGNDIIFVCFHLYKLNYFLTLYLCVMFHVITEHIKQLLFSIIYIYIYIYTYTHIHTLVFTVRYELDYCM